MRPTHGTQMDCSPEWWEFDLVVISGDVPRPDRLKRLDLPVSVYLEPSDDLAYK